MIPLYSNYKHVLDSALNCTNTSAMLWDYKDTCTLASQALGSYAPPLKGSSYTDQVFGTPIWHLANTYHDYAVINEFSNDDQYVIVCNGCESAFSETGIYSTITKQKVYKTPCEQFTVCGGAQWSNLHPDRLYVEVANGWHQYHLGNAPNLVDDGLAYTVPPGEHGDGGGSMTFTPEDYAVQWEDVVTPIQSVSGQTISIPLSVSWLAAGKVVRIQNAADSNLNGAWIVQSAPSTSSFTLSYTPTSGGGANAQVEIFDHITVVDLENRKRLIAFPFESILSQPMSLRTVHISPKESATGKWYVIAEDDYSTANQNHYYAARVLSFRSGDTTLTHEFYGPAAAEQGQAYIPNCTASIAAASVGNCFTTAHSTELNVNGVPYFVHVGGRSDPYQVYATAHNLGMGSNSAQSIYAGGGMSWWNTSPDHMAGSRLAPFLASNGDTAGEAQVFSTNIASVSGNTYTTDYPHGFQVGDSIVVAVDVNSTTDPSLDGVYTVQTVPSPTTFTLTNSPSSYAAYSAITYKTGADPNINTGGPQVQVCRPLPDGRVLQCRRIAMHLSTQFTASFHDTGYQGQTRANDYFAQPHVVISPNGKWVGWTSNLMHGNRDYFYIAETGFSGNLQSNQFTPATSVQVTPANATAAFHFTVPDTQAYTIETCTDPGISAGCLTPVNSAGPSLIHDAVVTSLASNVTYYWRIRSADNYYAAAGSFNGAGPPIGNNLTMALSPNSLALSTNGLLPGPPQNVGLTFSGGAGPVWTATSNQANITVSPTAGVGNSTLQISATAGPSGVVTVSAPGAMNSPQTIQVQIISGGAATPPFGSFDTPINNTTAISGAIAVTGWALDALGVTKVDIWRESVGSEQPGLVYLGDAVFVQGTRPDVAKIYASYPSANRAGWGYMLLTNFLPNNGRPKGPGNGTYNLHAIAHNQAGLVLDLGTRTIIVDNTDSTLPFGTIDTPGQGATAAGNAYVSFGWALTPMPAMIPTDGTTITVNVDGITLGHPTYGQFRNDIASSFPGLANSNGAIGFLYIDTTKLTNGVHTIGWGVWDNKLRSAGIGSRFFAVTNNIAAPAGDTAKDNEAAASSYRADLSQLADSEGAAPTAATRDDTLSMEIEEMDRIELPVEATSGYLLANGRRWPLPVGSTLRDQVFYWQLAPGFLGEYNLLFERAGATPIGMRVVVRPKTYSQPTQPVELPASSVR